jgi:16S rRNA (guanine527-N7)-methyltransferase
MSRPDIRVLLVEPLQRRVSWLEEVVTDLGLSNVEVTRARAEELWPTVRADVVTARAVAGLPVLARLCLPLVRPGGRFLAVKGRTAEEELAAAEPDLTQLGAIAWEVRQCGAGILAEPTTVIEVTMGAESVGRARRRGRGKQSGVRRR